MRSRSVMDVPLSQALGRVAVFLTDFAGRPVALTEPGTGTSLRPVGREGQIGDDASGGPERNEFVASTPRDRRRDSQVGSGQAGFHTGVV